MTVMYEKLVTPREGLRLHLNENTSGCSPAVLDVLRTMTCADAAYYPDYEESIAACAAFLGVAPGEVLLTNGLDEGILAAAITAVREAGGAQTFEAIVTVPSFDMYAGCVRAVGGRVVGVPHGPDLAFPLDGVLDAIRPATRLVFVTDPHNPSGLSAPREGILEIARRAPHATIFVDEAYADFRGRTLIGDPALREHRNVVVGRTYAKAHGLAGIRAGALVASADALEPLRASVPPYSVNAFTARALPAALADTAHLVRYVADARESKALLYAACERLGLHYWKSDANFVLVRIGQAAERVVATLARRGIYVRDRSRDPLCPGCVRITAGVVSHTARVIEALEEALCDAR